MSEPSLVLEHVSKFFGDFTAVDDISFSIPKGAIYGFLGPNGAGKTTTIRMSLSIYEPNQGSIRILGARSALHVRQRIGYLPEEKGLYKKMKVWSLIAYFGTLKGMTQSDAKKKSFELLEKYGLKDFAQHKCEALSKGMQQKVQVISAIVHDPEFVILDEPFSGLDPVNQGVMEELIRDIARKGHTVVFSTHVMQHAERMCDRILLIAKGKKIFDGTIPEAKHLIPRRVIIDTENDVSSLRRLNGVLSVEKLDGQEPNTKWEIKLKEQMSPQGILQACFQDGIVLRGFDSNEPSLHEVFVSLVGDSAKEASFR